MRRQSAGARALKRAFDVVASAVAIVVLLPLFGLITLMILYEDGRPVLFRQRRVGRDGDEFLIRKFRTMAPARTENTPLVTARSDARITKLGAVLRQTKLDELPQLLNILEGDMSIVGPRPEVPRYVQLYSPRDREIVLSVRPGLTDLATLILRDEQGILGQKKNPEKYYQEELLPYKLSLAAQYVQTQSFVHDLQLIGLTLLAIARADAAPVRALRRAFPSLDDHAT